MSGPLERRSPFLQLIDAFLKEENIKWVLGLGVCILLGSSLRLVTLHWVEYTPVWKYLILLGYSVTVFGLGELAYHRLGLRKTGTVLMSLTVLLIPISFLALHWIQPREDATAIDGLRHAGLLALLGLNLTWSAFASWRIFRHFLRRPQPTFFVCYLILCVAGAIVPGLPTSWGLGIALTLWAVMTIGTVKVNRHVFWLAEEHRLPRIFGFFPILLLGSQFAAVFLLGIAGHVTPAWLGLLATLVSLPILLTADAVTRVFEQRTGGLVRPIPWSISGPLALGTLLSAAGVVLALTGWPANPAIVPTAVIAAVSMGLVAHRTQRSAFVWGMLICVVVAYQTSPVFFKELVLQLRDQAASAVRESRLPYAFYGLTYAPLIVVFSAIAALLQRRGIMLFAKPIQTIATVLPCLLLGVSFTHPSAVLPVALLLCPLFAGQVVLFRNQQYLSAASMAFLAAAYGAPGFANRVLEWQVSSESALLIWVAASGLLLFPGGLCDRLMRRFGLPRDERSVAITSLCQVFSLGSTIVAAGIWLAWVSLPAGFSGVEMRMLTGALISTLLAIHAVRWITPGLGELTLIFATSVIYHQLTSAPWDLMANADVLCGLLFGQWGLSYVLKRMGTTRVAQAFGPATFRVSACGLWGLFGLFVLNWTQQHFGLAGFSWTTSVLMLAWSLDASRRMGSRDFATIAWLSTFVLVSALLTGWLGPVLVRPWLMTAWTMTGLVLVCVRQLLNRTTPVENESEETPVVVGNEGRRISGDAWLSPLNVILPILFLTIGTGSLMFLGGPQRLAGGLALVGLVAIRPRRSMINLSSLALPLANWQLLAACAAVWTGTSGLVLELTKSDLMNCCLPIAAFAGISLLVFESRRLRELFGSFEMRQVHQLLLLLVTVSLLGFAAQGNSVGTWTSISLVWAVLAWGAIAGTALSDAVRTQAEDRVWWGLGTLVGSLIYFNIVGVLNLLEPGIESVVLLTGIALWSVGRAVQVRGTFGVLSIPLQRSGFWLPLAVLPFAILRESADASTVWAGMNSLPLLGAATFYFWRGMRQRQLGTAILSAVLLNVAFVFLWKDLHWTDPQLFLMPLGISVLGLTELMHREIPSKYHDRLRYVGSLMILVSPVFHIVTGSWLHILTLMVVSVALALTSIGLRVRSLLYTSTAFLIADLIALVVRSSVDEPNVLWITGVALGASIIALGAICENHREALLARIRGVAAELEQWA